MTLDHVRGGTRLSVRDPFVRWHGHVSARPHDSAMFDRLAHYAIRRAEAELGRKLEADRKGGRIHVIRVFQAPCPRGNS